MTLSLRFGAIAIGLLMLVFLAATFVFDRQISGALAANEQARLRLIGERAADEMQRAIQLLRADAALLSREPATQSFVGTSADVDVSSVPALNHDSSDDLKRTFLALAAVRPSYLQIELTPSDPTRPALLQVTRNPDGTIVALTSDIARQQKPTRVRYRLDLENETALLATVDNPPETAAAGGFTTALRAVTPVADATGKRRALLAINMDVEQLYSQVANDLPGDTQIYLLDEQGFFVRHPGRPGIPPPGAALAVHLVDEFPEQADLINESHQPAGYLFSTGLGKRERLGYATARTLGSVADSASITLVVTESAEPSLRGITKARQKAYLTMGVSLLLSGLLVALVINRLMRSVRTLAAASQSVSSGNFDVEIPDVGESREVAKLADALKHMIGALRDREQRLIEMNRGLEKLVATRTRDLENKQTTLLRERAVQQSVLDHIGDGVLAIDRNGRFVFWNRPANLILGPNPDRVPMADWSTHFGLYRAPDGELIPVDELPPVRALRGETVRDEEMFVRGSRNIRGRWISVFARPLTTPDGAIDGAVTVLVDIEEKQTARARGDARARELARISRLTLMGQIVETTTHRLSQPLAAISNYVGAAIQLQSIGQLDDSRLDDILHNVSRLAERAGEDIGTLRLLNQQSESAQPDIDVNEIVSAARQLFEDRLTQLQVAVSEQLAKHPPRIIGYRDQLYQAVVQLLTNAIDALTVVKKESRRLILRTQSEGGFVRIGVGDSGPGVDAELGERIWDPWMTSKSDALGLGLSVVRTIAESHNAEASHYTDDDGMHWFVLNLRAEI